MLPDKIIITEPIFSLGLYTGISPMYLSEISPANIRGGIGVLHQLAIVSGILISQILGFPDLLGTPENWDVLLGELPLWHYLFQNKSPVILLLK